MNTEHNRQLASNAASCQHLQKPILRLESLDTGYTGRAISNNISLDIRAGEMVCLLGPNGCGKSTLMRTIAGLLPAVHGEVFIQDISLKKIKIQQRAKLLSLVLTDKIEVGNLQVGEIIAIGRHPYTNGLGRLTEYDREVIHQVMEVCNLNGFTNRLFQQLSDGEKQRVLIARALAQDTPLIMLDEPTAHLDLPNRIEMMKMLRGLAKKTNKAILLSTHELDLALQWADSIWLMNFGGFINSGTPEDLVLQGSFMRVFGNESYFFDLNSGSFKMQHPRVGTIVLQGTGIPYEWTRRALEREGYVPDAVANSKVEILSNGNWMYSCGNSAFECKSIREVLIHLHHETYYLANNLAIASQKADLLTL